MTVPQSGQGWKRTQAFVGMTSVETCPQAGHFRSLMSTRDMTLGVCCAESPMTTLQTSSQTKYAMQARPRVMWYIGLLLSLAPGSKLGDGRSDPVQLARREALHGRKGIPQVQRQPLDYFGAPEVAPLQWTNFVTPRNWCFGS